MKIILLDGTELESLGVHGRTITYQGINRDSLIFIFDPNVVDINTVKEKFTPENCESIILVEDHDEFIHENYCIRTELGQTDRSLLLNEISRNDGVQSSEVVYVKMAQMSYTEMQVKKQQEAIDALIINSLEG